ncbi:hypothetical protein HD806DRAFT_518566 [Xylariaceae sp. AK1471]|nr:hypothetical protein HD806DRAFT_518566 [Xylariaceae sp. AK1471]
MSYVVFRLPSFSCLDPLPDPAQPTRTATSTDTNSPGAFSTFHGWNIPVGEDDDDIQFLSEKPVKRRRISEKQPATPLVPHQPMISFAVPVVPNPPVTPMQTPTSDSRDTERRLSTGMVGLPSDLHAMELTYALRGVSMPVLENFVLDQPLRKPRPSSPPELSPKQLPSTISPAMLNVQNGPSASEAFSLQASSNSPRVCPSSSQKPCQVEKPAMTPEITKTAAGTDPIHSVETPINPKSPTTPTSSTASKGITLKNTSMPPPPLPCSEASQHQPCQACSRLRHQTQLSRAQGIPMVNAALPPHFMPQLHCHQAYGQHLHPQMMAMPTSSMHQLGPSFAPMMMPVNGSPFAALPSHLQPQPQAQQVTTQQQQGANRDKQPTPEQHRKAQSPQASQPQNAAASSSATFSPLKPPASLIQPTYRKPSPNLIVDVAETCQEKFPFEEVAKRHNVPVDKVFDVFAAIIQVPLLRCPTDRRRPGRLATARIKEYSKTKKDIQESRAGGREGDKQEAAVGSMDIAQRLGQIEFPEGFTPAEQT